MKYDPEIHHRRSIRLKCNDYSLEGTYYVTICTQERLCLFGDIVDGEMKLNDAGKMIETSLKDLETRFRNIEILAYVIMPNHVHIIIQIKSKTSVGVPLVGTLDVEIIDVEIRDSKNKQRVGTRPTPTTLGNVVGAFKSITTVEYTRGVKQQGWEPFPGRLWQKNYFERIIRNDDDLNRIREYIEGNPQNWDSDEENPAN